MAVVSATGARLAGVHKALFELDAKLLQHMHRGRKERLNKTMKLITHMGDPIGWAALTGGLAICGPQGRALVKRAVPSAVAAVITSYALKLAFGRPRPRVGIDNLEALVRDPDKYSFPSAHAASSTAIAVRTAIDAPTAGVPLSVLASLISFSRIYVGVHYPLDVLAGVILGSVTAVTEPLWMTILKVNARSTAQAIRAVWLRGKAVDRGLQPEDLQPPRASADR
jgi:undecaprenyl-diphosphatase